MEEEEIEKAINPIISKWLDEEAKSNYINTGYGSLEIKEIEKEYSNVCYAGVCLDGTFDLGVLVKEAYLQGYDKCMREYEGYDEDDEVDEEEIDDIVVDIMINDGPDQHCDGHEVIPSFILAVKNGNDFEWRDKYYKKTK